MNQEGDIHGRNYISSNLALHTFRRAVAQYCSNAIDKAELVGEEPAISGDCVVAFIYNTFYGNIRCF